MVAAREMLSVGENNMNARHSQQKNSRFLSLSTKALSLVLSILIFEGWAEVQRAERIVRVKVTAYGYCGE